MELGHEAGLQEPSLSSYESWGFSVRAISSPWDV